MKIPTNNTAGIRRRDAIKSIVALSAMAGIGEAQTFAQVQKLNENRASTKKYNMKKSINLWAFPYPDKMNLKQCLQLAKDAGFDGIELNYGLENDLSPKAGKKELREIRKLADNIGIAISGLCSFLFWQYPLTSNDPKKLETGLDLAKKMTEACAELGVENLLVVPGAVNIPWRNDYEPVQNEVCEKRAKEAVRKLLPDAEKFKIFLNIENIFFNGFLMTPMELNAFVDSFNSQYVRVHFDTGNIAMYQEPEHWIEILDKRIKNVHLKEFYRKGTDYSLEGFRPLLDGSINWVAVMDAFDKIGYRGYLTFEYFRPYKHYPEALIYHTSDALDRMLGRKT